MNGDEEALFAQAGEAREFWRARSLDDYDLVLLLPRPEPDVTGTILAALEEKSRRLAKAAGQPPRVVVLATVPPGASAAYSVMAVSEAEAENLLSLYCLYEFSGKLVIGSLDLPRGRKARNLLDGGVASGPDLIRALFF
jgi:hypothetical protein